MGAALMCAHRRGDLRTQHSFGGVFSDHDHIAALLAEARWTFAKTMPHIPHHYTLLKHWESSVDFLLVAQAIWDHGVQAYWGTRSQRCLHVGEYKYWSMDDTPETTDLIDRAVLEPRGLE